MKNNSLERKGNIVKHETAKRIRTDRQIILEDRGALMRNEGSIGRSIDMRKERISISILLLLDRIRRRVRTAVVDTLMRRSTGQRRAGNLDTVITAETREDRRILLEADRKGAAAAMRVVVEVRMKKEEGGRSMERAKDCGRNTRGERFSVVSHSFSRQSDLKPADGSQR